MAIERVATDSKYNRYALYCFLQSEKLKKDFPRLSEYVMTHEEEASFLVLILDCNPLFWIKQQQQKESQFSIDQYLNSICMFVNAFLTLHRGNKLAIFGITPRLSKLLYISPVADITESENADGMIQASEFEFAEMNESIRKQVSKLIEHCGGSLLAGALSHGLCENLRSNNKKKRVNNTKSVESSYNKGFDPNNSSNISNECIS
ncbi:hypothetical protein RFI_08512 [Reticulomyxa filosa]|uniref:Uncharacterized protein n=1 Tax=Reticulomyxa filosa TaxID=46433 RepID=X6NRP7_RETFI|nr:hypothetical protein RFI_08512 [Reticulomyxa filosa]|eukprot:ETO28618.1 hypothetical protein RFI_08512 [Reticulomyxa filosa]